MANPITLSLPLSEKELWDWFQKKRSNNEISASLVFRDALKELKKHDDINNELDAASLQTRLQDVKEIVGKFQDFIEKKGLQAEWFEYNEKSMQKEVFTRKGIETIEIDKSKKVKKKKKGGKK